jgi:hypothetical protein
VLRHLVVCCLQEGAEFIAAETDHRFTGPPMAAQQGRDMLQSQVAGRMSMQHH